MQRALEFERANLEAAARDVVEHPLGRLTLNPDHPVMWAMNELHVLGRHPDLTAAALMGELDTALADVPHRRATVFDDATGRRLAEDFRSAGWNVGPTMVMVLDGEPPAPPPGVVREADDATFRALLERVVGEDAAVEAAHKVAVIAGHLRLRAAPPGTRVFIAEDDGADAAYTWLYTEGRTGQPESVSTLAEHEGRGLAAATVSAATHAALAAGCDLVFILCLADSGPFPLYARLGFRAAGRFWTFTNPGPPP